MKEVNRYTRRAVITGLAVVGLDLATKSVFGNKTAPGMIINHTSSEEPVIPSSTVTTPVETLTPITEAPMPTPEIEKYEVPFIFKKGDPDKPYVYLTVDDCWERDLVSAMVENAETNGIHLTLFPVATVVRQNPNFWKDILSRGHTILNHSIDHPNITKLTFEQKQKQILGAKQILEDALGISVPVFRPPYGAMDKDVEQICRNNGIKIALWTIMSQGYTYGAHNKDRTVANATASSDASGLVNGGIICMHAINPDINSLFSVIQNAKNAGLKPVSMQEGII